MKKIGYILAAIYAVFSLSVTSFAFSDTVRMPLADGETSETEADDPDEADTSDTEADEPDESDTSDTEADEPDESDTSDTEPEPADTTDKPAETSDTKADVSSDTEAATTTAPTNVGNAGDTSRNPSTGVVLGFTALGLAAAGLTAGLAHKRK